VTRRVQLHPHAARDIREAVRAYDHRWPGLGQLVVSEVRRVLERLRLFPNAYPLIKTGIRHAAIGRLPYHAVYSATDDSIVIFALTRITPEPKTVVT